MVRFPAGPASDSCPGICVLENAVQEYGWGSKEAIPKLLGVPNPEGRPFAELWIGAHPKAASTLIMDGERRRLDGVIERFPERILGKACCRAFAGKLPFLFKVLAAEKPLSIQVHPGEERAREGFARENALGIPLDAPHRNYRDDNHKPEMLCALSRFEALKGFRKVGEILDLVDRVFPSPLWKEVEALRASPDSGGLKRFFAAILSMDEHRRRDLVSKVVSSAERRAEEDPAFFWVKELYSHFPGDVGALAPLMLNLVELAPGEAVSILDGELHAYLSGTGLELMANSDNVLRGGLTPKHVDTQELLENASFESRPVSPLSPCRAGECEETYASSVQEFQLSKLSVDMGRSFVSPSERSVEILLCTAGKGGIEDLESGEVIDLASGRSVLVPARVSRYRIEGVAVLYRASVPVYQSPR